MTGKPLMRDPRLIGYAEKQEEAQQRRAAKIAQRIKKGVKKRNPGKGARFPHLVNEPLRQFVRGLPCILAGLTDGVGNLHRCLGPVECCHLKTRGSGGADDDNCFPGCHRMHQQQEGRSHLLEAVWGIKLAAICRKVTARWLKEHPQTSSWLSSEKSSPRCCPRGAGATNG